MRYISIINDFHNTHATVRCAPIEHDEYFEIVMTDSQMRRVSKKLCGMADCRCGSIRGDQQFEGKDLLIAPQ
jgi:hypothetical protein